MTDPQSGTLPPEFLLCIENGPSNHCDTIVGSVGTNSGYCSLPEFKDTTYCSCVNSNIACPSISVAKCANAIHSYKNMNMVAGSPEYEYCSTHPICVNSVQAGGEHNLVSDVKQVCGSVKNVTNVVQANPSLIFLIVLLFISVIILLAMLIRNIKIHSYKK